MSGGHFNYTQFHFEDIAREIEKLILNNEYDYSIDTLNKFKKAAETCRKAAIMVQRVDYLVSDDDGEESFHKRWKEELKNI